MRATSRNPCCLKLRAGGLEDFGEHVLWRRDRSGEAHVAGGWVDVTFGHVGEHGSNQRVPELLRNRSRLVLHQVVVFPEDHMRTILLGTARRDDDGRLPAGDRVASLHPGELFEKHAVRLRNGRGLCRCARYQAGEANTRNQISRSHMALGGTSEGESGDTMVRHTGSRMKVERVL